MYNSHLTFKGPDSNTVHIFGAQTMQSIQPGPGHTKDESVSLRGMQHTKQKRKLLTQIKWMTSGYLTSTLDWQCKQLNVRERESEQYDINRRVTRQVFIVFIWKCYTVSCVVLFTCSACHSRAWPGLGSPAVRTPCPSIPAGPYPWHWAQLSASTEAHLQKEMKILSHALYRTLQLSRVPQV